jgi:hypothetical protein
MLAETMYRESDEGRGSSCNNSTVAATHHRKHGVDAKKVEKQKPQNAHQMTSKLAEVPAHFQKTEKLIDLSVSTEWKLASSPMGEAETGWVNGVADVLQMYRDSRSEYRYARHHKFGEAVSAWCRETHCIVAGCWSPIKYIACKTYQGTVYTRSHMWLLELELWNALQ